MTPVDLLAEAEVCLGLAADEAARAVRWRLANGHPDPLEPFTRWWWVPTAAMNLAAVRAAGWLLEAGTEDERDEREHLLNMAVWEVVGESADEYAG